MARPYGRGRRLFNLIAPWPIVLWVLAALVWPGAVSAPRSAVAAEQPKLLLLGDSLFAGYGLPPAEGFAAKLDAELRARGLDVALIDGGVSGDTTAGGLARLDWLLAEQPTDREEHTSELQSLMRISYAVFCLKKKKKKHTTSKHKIKR